MPCAMSWLHACILYESMSLNHAIAKTWRCREWASLRDWPWVKILSTRVHRICFLASVTQFITIHYSYGRQYNVLCSCFHAYNIYTCTQNYIAETLHDLGPKHLVYVCARLCDYFHIKHFFEQTCMKEILFLVLTVAKHLVIIYIKHSLKMLYAMIFCRLQSYMYARFPSVIILSPAPLICMGTNTWCMHACAIQLETALIHMQ